MEGGYGWEYFVWSFSGNIIILTLQNQGFGTWWYIYDNCNIFVSHEKNVYFCYIYIYSVSHSIDSTKNPLGF